MCACPCVYCEVPLLARCCVQGLVFLYFWMMPCRLYICIHLYIYVYVVGHTRIRTRALQAYVTGPYIYIHAHVKKIYSCKNSTIHEPKVRIYSNIKERESKNVYILCTYPETHTHTHERVVNELVSPLHCYEQHIRCIADLLCVHEWHITHCVSRVC